MKKYIFLSFVSLLFLSGLFFYQNAKLNDGKLHLVICDVGQGDAIYLKTPSGKDILVDGGPNAEVLDCLTNNMPFWDRTIDLVVLTHPDADHITGLIPVLERYSVLHFVTSKTSKSTAIYKKFLQILENEGLELKYVFANDKINFGDGVVSKIIWPSPKLFSGEEVKESKVNEYSVIQLITYGNFEALLTGDAGSEIMVQIANSAGDIDILKVPHHGSKTGMNGNFLSEVKPEIAVISVGVKNRYGHPSNYSLDLLDKHNVKVFRTDKNEEIKIVSDGNSYEVYPELN